MLLHLIEKPEQKKREKLNERLNEIVNKNNRTMKIFESNRDKSYLLSKILLYVIKLNEN